MHRAAILVAIAALAVVDAAHAQAELSGTWNTIGHEDLPDGGPVMGLGDYTGLPITAAARQWAESWDASRLTLPQHQCRAHAVPYIYRASIAAPSICASGKRRMFLRSPESTPARP